MMGEKVGECIEWMVGVGSTNRMGRWVVGYLSRQKKKVDMCLDRRGIFAHSRTQSKHLDA